ncbi:unnamed protein product, partial [Iphiclides podalirius]
MDALTEHAQSLASSTFVYADDVAVSTTSREELEKTLEEWKRQLRAGGLVLSVAKTQYMVCNDPNTVESGPLTIDGQQVVRCDLYKYLGTMLHSSGEVDVSIQHRIPAAWLKWRVTYWRNL